VAIDLGNRIIAVEGVKSQVEDLGCPNLRGPRQRGQLLPGIELAVKRDDLDEVRDTVTAAVTPSWRSPRAPTQP
jgi:hypothetical protein